MKKPNRSLWQCSMAALLSFSMITSQVPAVAFAEEGQPTEENQVVQEGQPLEGQDTDPVVEGSQPVDGLTQTNTEGEILQIREEAETTEGSVPDWVKGLQGYWPAYRGGDKKNVVNSVLPTTNGELDWSADVKSGAVSEPIVVAGDIYLVAGNNLIRLNGARGEEEATADLGEPLAAGAHISYERGVISVPVASGVTKQYMVKNLTPVTTTTAQALEAAEALEAQSQEVTLNGYKVTLDTNTVTSAKDGATVDTQTFPKAIDLTKGVKSTAEAALVYASDGATLYKVVVGKDGDQAGKITIQTIGNGVSIPTEANGRVYVGDGPKLMIVDEKLTVTEITKANQVDGSEADIAGNVVTSPLVSTAGGTTWVYFTSDGAPGALYSFNDREGSTIANVLYVPVGDQQGANTTTPVPTEDGSILIANNSGTLFKVKAGWDVAPRVTVDEVSAKGIDKGQTSTFTIKQVISKDATSVKIWMVIPEEMEYVSKATDIAVTQNGNKVNATATIDGRKLTVDVKSDVATLRDKEIQFDVKAKVKENADLTKYEAPLAYAVPVGVTTQFNGETDRELSDLVRVIVNKTVTPEDLNPAPTMSTDKGDNPISRTDEVTFTISQKVPEDAISVVTWHTMEPVLHYMSKVEDIVVRVKDGDVLGRDVAAVNLEGQKLTVTIKDGDAKSTTEEAKSEDTSAESKDTENKESESKDAESKETTDSSKALESQGEDTTSEQTTTDQKSDAKDNAEATTDGATETTGSTSSTHATDLRGKTIEVTFKGKINDDAKLDAYLNAAGNVASIPYQATTQFNEDDQQVVKSEVKSLKVSVGSSNSGSATNRTATATTGTTTRTTTPSTGDESVQVTWIIVAAIAVILVAVALRLRAARKKE